MTTVVTRAVKGSPLSYVEMDANFNNLNSAKLEAGTAGTNIANTPAGNIAATTVQAAINELDTEKLATTATALNGTTIPASKTLVVTTDIGSTVQGYVTPGTSGNVLTSNGSAWISYASGAVPAGTIIDFTGTSAPTGYLACPTSLTNISRTTYATLFAAIGTTWGVGDGSTTFGLPWFPADYTAIQANGDVGTASTGQNLSHTHTVTQRSTGTMSGSSDSPGVGGTNIGPGGIALVASGGSANLAAGHRVLKCVKY